jgi:hypothetical protein
MMPIRFPSGKDFLIAALVILVIGVGIGLLIG